MDDGQINPEEALQRLRNHSNIVADANALFPARPSPDLTGLPFLPYRITPKYPNWKGITLIPILEKNQTNGILGVEVVSQHWQIVSAVSIPLAQAESHQPVFFSWPPINDSDLGTFELRVFTRDNVSPVRVLEGRFLRPINRLRRWRTRLLCKLTFENDGSDDRLVWSESTELSPELATSVGSRSFEDHYWVSGWQTANVQLLTDLQPNDSIIDIGCGVGRLAYGFHGWYGGRFVGTDIMSKAIDYCKKAFPRFQFFHLDIHSPYYNPKGKMDATKMVLPVDTASFDVAILFSVYTHLLPNTFLRMTSEISRVLKPQGRCLATFFILDNQTENAIFSLRHSINEYCRVEDKSSPEGVVGYTMDYVVETFAKSGLQFKAYYPGSWTGRPGLSVQDQILFVKD